MADRDTGGGRPGFRHHDRSHFYFFCAVPGAAAGRPDGLKTVLGMLTQKGGLGLYHWKV